MSSTHPLSWLGDPDVNVMSEDGHIVMTHRSVLGLYSSSFRHLLSINPPEGGQCMIICHDMDANKVEELVRNAQLNFQRLTYQIFQNEYVEIVEQLTKLKSTDALAFEEVEIKKQPFIEEVNFSIDQSSEAYKESTAHLNFQKIAYEEHQNEFVEIEEHLTKLKPNQISVEETMTVEVEIQKQSYSDNLESTIIPKDFQVDNENDEKNEKSTPVIRNPTKLISIEEVNISIDHSSEAYKEFKSLDRFGQIDLGTKILACKLCDKTYANANFHDAKNRLRYHIDSAHMEKYLSCRFCRKEFYSAITFRHHYKMHLIKEKFRCEQCGKNGDRTHLLRHIQTVHLNQRNFKCELCGITFKGKDSLSHHVQSKHEDKEYPCQYCNHKSVNQRSLNHHIKLKHEKTKSYKCKYCDYVCYRDDYLSKHVRSIHENVRFPCDQCEYQATRKQYLASHIKKIHLSFI